MADGERSSGPKGADDLCSSAWGVMELNEVYGVDLGRNLSHEIGSSQEIICTSNPEIAYI